MARNKDNIESVDSLDNEQTEHLCLPIEASENRPSSEQMVTGASSASCEGKSSLKQAKKPPSLLPTDQAKDNRSD